jgi:hypothetical protein
MARRFARGGRRNQWHHCLAQCVYQPSQLYANNGFELPDSSQSTPFRKLAYLSAELRDNGA